MHKHEIITIILIILTLNQLTSATKRKRKKTFLMVVRVSVIFVPVSFRPLVGIYFANCKQNTVKRFKKNGRAHSLQKE